LRVGFSGNYAIYYLQNEHELVIVRVLHGARDAAAVAEHGGFKED
jgi:toxin ParE1/3/4